MLQGQTTTTNKLVLWSLFRVNRDESELDSSTSFQFDSKFDSIQFNSNSIIHSTVFCFSFPFFLTVRCVGLS